MIHALRRVGWTQALDRIRQDLGKPGRDRVLLAMIQQTRSDDGDPDQRQREWKHERVLEHPLGQVGQVTGNAEGTEHRIDPPAQQHGQQHEPDIEEAVERLGDFAAAFGEAQAAPERHQAEEMEPERKVSTAWPAVDDPGDEQDTEPEPHGHDATLVPGELGAAEQPWREVHGHEPERNRDDRDDEREAVEPKRYDPGHDRGDLHEKTAAIDYTLKIAHGPRLTERAPEAERILNAIDRKSTRLNSS